VADGKTTHGSVTALGVAVAGGGGADGFETAVAESSRNIAKDEDIRITDVQRQRAFDTAA
jgi:hypothetical protein